MVNKVEYTKYRQGLSIVHRNSPLVGDVEREDAVRTAAARWGMRIGSLLCLLTAATATRAQETPPPTALRRVVLLPPPVQDAALQKWVTAERAAIAQDVRKGGLLGFFFGRKSAPKPAQTDPKTPKSRSGKPLPLPEATPGQLHALCESLLYDDLAATLRTKRHLDLPTETEVRAALMTLHLTPAALQSNGAAQRLGRALDCDAVLLPELTHLERNEGATRSMTLRGTMRLVRLDSAERSNQSAPGRRRKRERTAPALPVAFPFFGTAVTGHVLFKESYRRTPVQLVADAAQQAAAVAAHTFWTGEIAPFARATERVALLPVPSPTDADALLFTPQGRRVATAAVRDLPADLAAQFQPDIAPLSGKEIVPVEQSRAALRQEGITVAALWRQDQPEAARVQALGARLEVSYVLMAHITAVELQTGTADAGETFATREARAEAVGALVRVADGVVLWQEHATATMTLHPKGDDKTHSIDRQAVQEAEHYALTELQRRFRAYRARFEN